MAQGNFGVLGPAKFDDDRWYVSPLRGKKRKIAPGNCNAAFLSVKTFVSCRRAFTDPMKLCTHEDVRPILLFRIRLTVFWARDQKTLEKMPYCSQDSLFFHKLGPIFMHSNDPHPCWLMTVYGAHFQKACHFCRRNAKQWSKTEFGCLGE